MKCLHCNWPYPDELVQPLVIDFKVSHCCGICALQLTNEIHGINREKFDGTYAEKTRLRAIRYRAEHPERAPLGGPK